MNNGPSMKTPLKQVRGLGSSHTGTEHFWQQRLTALFNIPLVIFMIGFIISHLGSARADVVAALHHPVVAVVMAAGLLSVIWHMKLGLQMVIEDYVHGPVAKISALILNLAYAALLAGLALYALLKMSFGV